jgi:ferrous iron transport protein A
MQNRKRRRQKGPHKRKSRREDLQKRHRNRGTKKKAFSGILERSDVFESFKRQEEDVLKYIFEQDQKKVPTKKLIQVFRRSNGEIEYVIRDLIKEKYVIENDNYLSLTPVGEEIAELVFRIHNEIEEYIKDRNLTCNAHQMAHILEHRLSEEQIDRMMELSKLKERGVSLSNFELSSGEIVDVVLKDCKVWTKLVSIGIFPGQKIHILTRTNSNYLIEIKNSKFAIDYSLADRIFLIP